MTAELAAEPLSSGFHGDCASLFLVAGPLVDLGVQVDGGAVDGFSAPYIIDQAVLIGKFGVLDILRRN